MPFIILDRDGVINYDSDEYIKSPEEWQPIPYSLDAIAKLNRFGYRVLIATNQSGIARGYFDIEMLDRIHEKLTHELRAVGGYIEEIFFCPHHPKDHCSCRKPNPGLLYQMQERYQFNFPQTFFIGDAFSDVKAAQSVGCVPLLVMTGKGQFTVKQYPEVLHVPNFFNLAEAVDYVLSRSSEKDE